MEMFSKEVNDQVAALVREVDQLRIDHNVGACRYHDEAIEKTPDGQDDIVHAPMRDAHPKCYKAIKEIEAKIFDLRGGRSAVHTGRGPAVGAAIERPIVPE